MVDKGDQVGGITDGNDDAGTQLGMLEPGADAQGGLFAHGYLGLNG